MVNKVADQFVSFIWWAGHCYGSCVENAPHFWPDDMDVSDFETSPFGGIVDGIDRYMRDITFDISFGSLEPWKYSEPYVWKKLRPLKRSIIAVYQAYGEYKDWCSRYRYNAQSFSACVREMRDYVHGLYYATLVLSQGGFSSDLYENKVYYNDLHSKYWWEDLF